jgi:hypothetical protein
MDLTSILNRDFQMGINVDNKREHSNQVASVIGSWLLFFLFITTILFQVEASEDDKQALADHKINPYKILRKADYIKVTGCKNLFAYNHSLQTAINYLVFSKDHVPNDKLIRFTDLEYARRHTRSLYSFLRNDKGFIEQRCLHPTLKRIGLELGLIDENGRRFQLKSRQLPVVHYQYPVKKESVPAFEIMSRSDYIKITGCLASPTTYHKYHLAFFQAVLGWGSEKKAATNLKAFLQELGEGRRTKKGLLDPVCMPPSVGNLAKYLGILNQDGQFKLQ